MGRTEKRQCLNCGESFTIDARNARHQRYCTALPCKAASKRARQAKWLAKPENRDYHRGPEAVARVKAWRAAHPGYSRRKGSSREAVQEDSIALALITTAAAPARRELIALDLIAYDPPLHQVLSLPKSAPVAVRLGRLHALLAGRP